MDCSLPGSSVQVSLQARILEWVAMPFKAKQIPSYFSFLLFIIFFVFLGHLFLHTHFKNHFIYFKDKVSSQENLQFANCCCSCLATKSFLTPSNPMDCRPSGSSLHRISRQEYWNELPFPSQSDLPNPRTELASPALEGEFFTIEPPSSVQFSLSVVSDSATPCTATRQASLSITNSRSPPRPMSIESMMPSNHLILCRPLLLLPSIFPSIRVFPNESALHIRWSEYWTLIPIYVNHIFFLWNNFYQFTLTIEKVSFLEIPKLLTILKFLTMLHLRYTFRINLDPKQDKNGLLLHLKTEHFSTVQVFFSKDESCKFSPRIYQLFHSLNFY